MQNVVPSVWMLTDEESGEPSYVQMSGKGSGTTIGPFTYTKEKDAKAAAANPTFLPKGPQAITLDAVELKGMGLVQGILAGFEPADSDVFSLNDSLLPLTKAGAAFVDGMEGDTWQPLFEDDDAPAWLAQVLEQVSRQLGVEVIQVRPNQDTALEFKAQRARRKIQEYVRIFPVPEQGHGYGLVPATATFRVMTVGMTKFGRPELEQGGVPAIFVKEAQVSLAGWAAYSLDFPLKDGEILQGSTEPVTVLLQVAASPDDPEVLRLSPHQVVFSSPSFSGMLH